jgi:hypothetical protein
MKHTKPRKLKRAAKKRVARRPRRSRVAASKPDDSIEALVESYAQALGLSLDPAWHASIAFNLRLILRHVALVNEFKLPDDTEPAPIFHA